MTYNNKKSVVVFRKSAEKDLKRLPQFILASLQYWASLVSLQGIQKTRLISGFHDEPLMGKRKRQRSVRLNKAYRVIYVIVNEVEIELVEVIEVNKHKY